MKHLTAIPAALLLVAASHAMADEPYKHQYNNNGHYDGLNGTASTEKKASAAPSMNSDPSKLASDSKENIDVNTLPPTAAIAPTPAASPAAK